MTCHRFDVRGVETKKFAWVLGFAVASACHAQVIEDITPSGGQLLRVRGVSADGTAVIGWYDNYPPGGPHAFRWSTVDGFQDIGPCPWPCAPTAYGDDAYGVSGSGDVVVGFANQCQAFRWSVTEGFEYISQGPCSVPGYGHAYCTNSDGSVVGGMRQFSPAIWRLNEDSQWEAFLVDLFDTGTAGIGEIESISADGNAFVGTTRREPNSQNVTRLWRVTPEGIRRTDLLFSPNVWLSADGRVVTGYEYLPPQCGRGFRWSEETGYEWLAPGQMLCYPSGISGDGSIIIGGGMFSPATTSCSGEFAGFIWTPEIGYTRLDTFLQDKGVDLAEWSVGGPVGISADGTTLVGHFGFHQGLSGRAWRIVLPCITTPNLFSHPTESESCVNGSASTTAVRSMATPVNYQWQYQDSGSGSQWRDLAEGADLILGVGSADPQFIASTQGSTEAQLQISVLQRPVNRPRTVRLRCIGSNDCGTKIGSESALYIGLRGDADDNGSVGLSDIAAIIGQWNQSVPPDIGPDLDADGMVSLSDLAAVITNWARVCL